MDDTVEKDGNREEQQAARTREPVFNLAGSVLALIIACVAIHLFRMYLLTSSQDSGLVLRLAFIPLRYSGEYAIDIYALVSPLTYSFLHGNFLHLGINMIWLAAFGSPLANRIETGRFLLFWCLTVLAAVLLHYLLHPLDMTPVVGASGAISGMMGAAARFAFRIDRREAKAAFDGPLLSMAEVVRSRNAMVFLGVWLLINLATGLGFGGSDAIGQIAWEAHIGGFLGGFFGIALLDRDRSKPPTADEGTPPGT
ncbi:membrane associated rhomboid family serine protease [Mesorhizobium sp. J18]|nr:rhomboid family intramembrane serine protease [Mesorhizobium sp. J18]TWG93862.1 membrane associated rhomboid family serine protease [Mesorhizobium sp. J18]